MCVRNGAVITSTTTGSPGRLCAPLIYFSIVLQEGAVLSRLCMYCCRFGRWYSWVGNRLCLPAGPKRNTTTGHLKYKRHRRSRPTPEFGRGKFIQPTLIRSCKSKERVRRRLKGGGGGRRKERVEGDTRKVLNKDYQQLKTLLRRKMNLRRHKFGEVSRGDVLLPLPCLSLQLHHHHNNTTPPQQHYRGAGTSLHINTPHHNPLRTSYRQHTP